MNKILLRVLIIVAIVVLVLIGSLCALRIYREINVKKSSKNVSAVPTIKVSETVDSISFKKEHSNEDKLDKSVVTWKSTEFGFRCMANMIYKEIFEDNVPTTFYVYVNAVSELSYSVMGAWAVMDFPAVEQYIAPGTTIANITYKNVKKHIYSGYASDGRIFYLKTRVLDGGEVDHLAVLCLLYEKNAENDNMPLIEEVRKCGI